MSVNYVQECIIGVAIPFDDLEVIDSPAIYEMQNRYCTNTGKVLKQEKVLVKKEISHIEFHGKKYDCYDEIRYDVPEWVSIEDDFADEILYMGIRLPKKNYGRFTCINLSLSLEEIQSYFEKARTFFKDQEVGMHFFDRIC